MTAENVIRTAVVVPLKIARGAIDYALGLLDEPSDEQRVRPVREAPPGPELHVDEPWEGYRRMQVDEIVARLEGQSAEGLAAVELYESTHRHRGAVLNAVRSAERS